jgi:PmbA protein
MTGLRELGSFARAARALVLRDREVAAFEIYCASAEHRIARLNYTSDIPCRGVEELKSLAVEGFQLRIQCSNPHEVGTASEAAELSLKAVARALSRAHRTAVVDPNFPGFPASLQRARAKACEPGDLGRAGDGALVESAWAVVAGAGRRFARSDAASSARPGLVVGGDITIVRDRMALAGSNFAEVRADESAHFVCSVAALVESLDAKATASAVGRSASAMRRAGATVGGEAVGRALALRRGARPEAGEYRVVLGPQPVAEILHYIVMGSLTTGAFYAANSAYQGRFGGAVMDERLGLYDTPRMRGGAIARRFTCEGLPTKRVELVRDGRLVGLLSNFYDSHRLRADTRCAEKLGPGADGRYWFAPLSGYRLGEGGGRRFDQHPASTGTNVVMRARKGVDEAELVRRVGNGLYVGRVWYTYPINGQRAGDFTCTVSGDSYLIEEGRTGMPLVPNSLRINANIDDVFGAVLAASKRARSATVWGAAEAYYVPALAVERIRVEPVGERSSTAVG